MKYHTGIKDLAKEYRKKYGWDMPTLKLARIMYKENNLLITSVEHARATLRSLEGKSGSSYGVIKDVPNRSLNPYAFPKSEETSYDSYPLKAKRLLVLSDIHLPYHSIEALTCTFDYAKKEKPDAILLNGDTLDFYGLSRFNKNPKARDFAYELAIFKDFIQVLQSTFNCKIYFKIGNHEERYEHFLQMKAHELIGVDEFTIENIIRARAEGIEIIGNKRIMKAGDLNILHGHEFGGSIFSPVNIARGLFLRGKVSAMQGHNHQTSEHTESNMNGDIVTTWSLGCLCELHPAYLPINKWNHGFSIVEIDGKNFEVRNKRIHKGKCL